MQNNYSKEVTYGGFFVRMSAYLIDSLIVGVGLVIIRIMLAVATSFMSGDAINASILFNYSLEDIILYICKVIYFVLLTYYTGTTLGKRLMNLRVVNKDGEKPDLFSILYRETVGRFLSGLVIGIGYIMAGIDKEKRGLHDMLADTYVVYEKKVKIYYEMPKPMPMPQPQPMNGMPPQRPMPSPGLPPKGMSINPMPPQGSNLNPVQGQVMPPQKKEENIIQQEERNSQNEERGL